ncbi:Pex19 protein family-domain-containing protein [Amanita rubescens]|nr:Pex19 protein family-domain-containing protein [Amanita rubescens]
MSSKHLDVDDDVDELDDVLQEFNNDDVVQNPNRTGTSGRLRHNTTVDAPIPPSQRPTDSSNGAELGTAFARELAEQMEEYLLGAFSSTNLSASLSKERDLRPPGQGLAGLDAANGAEVDGAFSQEFTTEMETFMREIGVDPSTLPGDGITDEESGERDPEKEREAEEMFKRLWEAINTSGGSETDGTKAGSSNTEASTSQAPAKGKGFQDVLRPVMDKMKESEESNTQKGTSSGEATAPENLEELIASLSNLGSGIENEEELGGFLENMMRQLLGKEVLYEPLKELSDKFPGYLASPPSPIGPTDRQRYEKQLVVINKIIAVFDAPNFRDDNPETHKTLVELMSEVQSYGSPPEELMGPLPPGLGLGTDGVPGCVIT